MGPHSLSMIVPVGTNFGWGICGKYLAKELSRLCNVELFTEEFGETDVGDETIYRRLRALHVNSRFPSENTRQVLLQNPVLQTIQGCNLKPWFRTVKSPYIVGYTFFETNSIAPESIASANSYYDVIVAGSTWCERILNKSGFANTKTILQGIDTELFHPEDCKKTKYQNRFVIFSGGKLELRKGQDLVIRAFKILQEKYPDMLLVNLWYNQWSPAIESMKISPYIRFEMPPGDYFSAVNHLLRINGVDPQGVVSLPPMPQNELREIYKNTDVGLFPNRCEGGSNLMLMEYMASGKPAVATLSSGHQDVLSDGNSIPLRHIHPFTVRDRGGKTLYEWDEVSLEEIVATLEWAYWNRDKIMKKGERAGKDLARLTWHETAKQFYELLY